MMVEEPKWLPINQITDRAGDLRILELPFEAKRTYFIQNVPHGSQRGFHAHRSLRQIFFAPQGSFEIELITSISKRSFLLNSTDQRALVVPPGYWRIISSFSKDATCMVLASEHYMESDYIRNFDEYVSWCRENLKNES
jgi:dTDP-4-dehydrorhamnose 3,5-epimerase-like enzyme